MPLTPPEILGRDGPVARALARDYEPREPQLRMARAVADAMDSRSTLLVEAGTGVGKSFAYLVPAVARCLTRGEIVLVATNTIALQEQLIERDIPLLLATLSPDTPGWSGDLRAILVKGRGNYVSIRRLKLASSRQDRLLPDAASRRSLHAIEDWAYSTTDGTLSTLPTLERHSVWDKVQSDSGNCMGRKCPHYNECFYQSARRAIDGAGILVCNHALFFADLAMKARGVGFLPRVDHVILDEAHALEDVAAEHFGLALSEGTVTHLLSTLHHARLEKGYLAQLALQAKDIEPIDRTIGLVQNTVHASHEFFESLLRLHHSGAVRNGRVREPRAVHNPLTPAIRELAARLRALRELAPAEPDMFELNAYAERASDIADMAEAWVEQTTEDAVYWIEARRGDDDDRPGPRVGIAASPVDVAPALARHLFDGERSVVLTSATLSTRAVRDDEPPERAETAFAHAMHRLGCEGARTLQLGSPFDHASQVEFYVDRSMPTPPAGLRANPDAAHAYLDALASRILRHVRATEGGAFVLFTSFAMLQAVDALVRPALAPDGYQVFAQARDGPRTEILARFRDSPRAVLLGAASFWQGVDVRGRALRNVIITRLPFEPPDRPLVEARLERIQERGGDPFREDSLPRAVIRFKQGFGRLIRSSTDTGRVVVLDPRILSTGYGRAFLAALPPGVRPRVIHANPQHNETESQDEYQT